MTELVRTWSRLLALALPQATLSAIAIAAFVHLGAVSPRAGVTHCLILTAAHVGYFALWGWAARCWALADRRGGRLAFAAAGVLKGTAINVVYVASYSSTRLWAAYLTWANLSAIGPHLRGFAIALGSTFTFAWIGLAVGLVVWGLVAGALAQRGLRAAARSVPDAHSFLSVALLVAVLVGVAGNFYARDPLWAQFGRRDPLVAFWTNRPAVAPVWTAAMTADRAEADAYRVPASFLRRNVIVVAIDCLRADRLAFNGYSRSTAPFLESWWRQGRFHAVTLGVANGNNSPLGIRNILNARTPPNQNLQNFRLPDVLKRAGYRTHVFGTGDHTTLGEIRPHYGPNIDVFHDGLSDEAYSLNDDRGLLRALENLPAAGSTPSFFYLHLMSVHELGVREQQFVRWEPAKLGMDWAGLLRGTPDPVLIGNIYDNGVLQADDVVRRALETLEAKGYLRDFVGVIVGDHGQGLGEHGHYGHSEYLFAEDVNIPILFFENAAADYGPMPFGSQVDIAPTLLDRLGLPRPGRWEGRSLYRAAPPERIVSISAQPDGWHALLVRRGKSIFKYLRHHPHRADGAERLYDETADPAEESDLAGDPAHGQMLLEIRREAAQLWGTPFFE